MTTPSVEDKTALVTGASSGIGRQQATALAAAGARVVLLGRRLDALQDTAKTIGDAGGEAHCVVADLAVLADIEHIVTEVKKVAGTPIDILCNTAGVNHRQAPTDITLESWQHTLDLNLSAPFFLARALIEDMRQRQWGRIINVASLQTQRAFPNGMAYGASKGGIGQLTRAMAEAWSADGITTGISTKRFRNQARQSHGYWTQRCTSRSRWHNRFSCLRCRRLYYRPNHLC